jgi:hypothetical protein
VELRFPGNSRLRIDRPDGYLATLSRTGISDRQLPLKRRELGDLLAEELRRLDSDQPYADSLSAVTGEKGLDERPPMRTLIWRDPARRAAAAKPATGAKPVKSSKPAKAAKSTKAAKASTSTKAATKAAPRPAAKSPAKSATKRTGTKSPARKAATGKKKSAP